MNIQLFPHTLNQSQGFGNLQKNAIIKGKVLEILPNNLALVQIGNKQVTAKTEGMLRPGTPYLFQVKNSDDPVLLKMISASVQEETGKPAEVKTLLNLFKLTDTPAMEKLVRVLTAEQIPLQKESLQQAELMFSQAKQPMKLVGPLKWMLGKQLPMSPAITKLVEAAGKPQMNAGDITNQLKSMLKDPNLPQSLKKAISSLAPSINTTEGFTEKETFELLKSMGPLGKNSSLAPSFIQQIQTSQKSSGSQQITVNFFQKKINEAPDLKTLLNELFPAESYKKASAHLTEAISKQPMLMRILNSGTEIKPFLKEILLKMGFQHEHQIAAALETGEEISADSKENLKAALIQLTQDSGATSSLKQNADTVLQQMTLQQLQMVASDKGWMQWAMQLPLPIQDTFKKASFFWEGKKASTGETLDPNHCHILCYLELEQLKETVLQIRIQDRMVSLTVHNEHVKLMPQIKKWETVLKLQLENHNYQLVSLIQSEKIEPSLKTKLASSLMDTDRELDVRI